MDFEIFFKSYGLHSYKSTLYENLYNDLCVHAMHEQCERVCDLFLINKTLVLIVFYLVSTSAAHIIANSCSCELTITLIGSLRRHYGFILNLPLSKQKRLRFYSETGNETIVS